ncbi:glycosyltransferase family 4 protein [Streptomyces sp. NPDC047315]|uniref:glycosyltransferase family 4 protein n=1 Tax=Streptomyces sp. NPDC047315 TaxID=3155142 RepID=UPI00340AA3EF
MPKTLIVTNDFPPRQGGIETFVHAMAVRFAPGEVVVYTSAEPGAGAHDAALPFPVVRDRARTLLPTRRVTDRAVDLVRAYDCDAVWFGAAAPLALMAGALRRRAPSVRRIVATTHGHEVWWARTPGTRQALRRIGATVDTVTHLGDYTRRAIAPALGRSAAARMHPLTPGVDPEAFAPRPDATALRTSYGVAPNAPVILCAARLVPRKGQDVLIRALPLVHRSVPKATLLLVGAGPYARRLRRLAAAEGVPHSVIFAGGHPHSALPAFYAASDVFAMPCRTRRAGLEVEGLGIVYLEAAATALPTLTGTSGGAPATTRDGETGYVVDGRDIPTIADRLTHLLTHPELAHAMGRKARSWVRSTRTWNHTHDTLRALLAPAPPC